MRIASCPNLLLMAPWVASSASVSGASNCSALPPVVIETQDDFDTFMQNTALRQSSVLGSVVITWTNISNGQLTAVLGGKVAVDELVLEGLTAVTTLSPTLDSMANITSRIVLDSMSGLTTVGMPSLVSVGSGFRVFGLTRVTSISFPNVTTIGGVMLIQNMNALTSMSFDALSTVNGSLSIYNLALLSGSAMSDAFPQLQTVAGGLTMQTFSISGSDARTTMLLPQVVYVGSLYLRNTYVTAISMPALRTIGGAGQQGLFLFQDMAYVRSLDFPALASVSGQIQLLSLAVLANLCQVALPSSGYLSSNAVRVSYTLRASRSHCVTPIFHPFSFPSSSFRKCLHNWPSLYHPPI